MGCIVNNAFMSLPSFYSFIEKTNMKHIIRKIEMHVWFSSEDCGYSWFKIVHKLFQLLTTPVQCPFLMTTWVDHHQRGKMTILDFNEAQDMTVASAGPHTDCWHTATPAPQWPDHSILTGRMFFVTPNQHCPSTECQQDVDVDVLVLTPASSLIDMDWIPLNR